MVTKQHTSQPRVVGWLRSVVGFLGWGYSVQLLILLVVAAYFFLILRPYETAPLDKSDRKLLEQQFAWPVVLNETYSNTTETAWDTGTQALNEYSVQRSFTGGAYLWQVSPVTEVSCCRSEAYYTIPIGSMDDFLISVDFQKRLGDEGMTYGILYHYVDRDNYYQLSLNDIGNLSVSVWSQGEWESVFVIRPRLRSVIRSLEPNNLLLSVQDGQTMIFVNGVYIGQFDDKRVKAGSIALMVDPYGLPPYTEISFDNIVVRLPEN